MLEYLGGAPDAQVVATELVLEPGVTALGHRAFVVADGLRGVELNLFATARIVVNQWNVAQAFTVLAQLGAAVGGIHHIVQIGYALRAHQRQGNGGKAVSRRSKKRFTAMGCLRS